MLEDDEEGESIYLCVCACVLFRGGGGVEMCIQDTWQARDQPAH